MAEVQHSGPVASPASPTAVPGPATVSTRAGALLATRPRVVIVGAGFGGLSAARRLEGLPVEVLVLNRANYHLFTPLLYQVATGGLTAEQIAHPVRHILRSFTTVSVRVTTVIGVRLAERVVETDTGDVPYDYLVLAAGSATNFFGLDASAAGQLKDLPDALAVRERVLAQVERAASEPDAERRRALLTFVVVGGGPTGVEMAGALTELLRLALPRDFPTTDLSVARVILLEAADTVLAPFPPRLRRWALRSLARKGVDVRLGATVARITPERVELASGEAIKTGVVVWAAGVRAAALDHPLDAPHGPGGRLLVDEQLRLPDHPEVFVIGDLAGARQDGAFLPMLAPVAIQQGQHVARAIAALVGAAASPPPPFRYRDRGIMATIGRNAAVARIGRLQLTGRLAWAAWLALHLVQIIGFRNRLFVLINWAWDYLRYDQAVRLLWSAAPRPPAARANGEGERPR